jgi:hypothetical protein
MRVKSGRFFLNKLDAPGWRQAAAIAHRLAPQDLDRP